MINPTSPIQRSARPVPRRAVRVVSPLAALAYPGLIWAGSRTHPIVLATALLVPLLALWAAHQLGLDGGSPRGRRIAHLAVAAPPLFSLGGWLDFTRAIPVGSVAVWLPLWSLLALVALLEPAGGATTAPAPAPAPRLATAHGVAAALITLFVVAHLGNHLAGLGGGDTHIAVMRVLRLIYRHRAIEPILLAALAFQIATGLSLLHRKLARRPGGWFDTLQTTTGAYMFAFLLSHVSAALRARHLRNVDTNWTWLSGGELLTDPWSARLVPYYFLAVIALGVHGACGLRSVVLARGGSPALGARLVALFAGIATLISSLILAGLFRA